MLNREQEENLTTKQGIEYFCFKYFAHWQDKERGISLDFDRFGSPPEPDILALLDGKSIGVEVATLYSSDYDAARLLGRIEDKDYKDKLQAEALIPLDRIYPRLDNIIRAKQEKQYAVEKPWLVIQNAFPLFSKEDFVCVEGRYSLGQFKEIWLLCDVGGRSGILRLDNEQ